MSKRVEVLGSALWVVECDAEWREPHLLRADAEIEAAELRGRDDERDEGDEPFNPRVRKFVPATEEEEVSALRAVRSAALEVLRYERGKSDRCDADVYGTLERALKRTLKPRNKKKVKK